MTNSALFSARSASFAARAAFITLATMLLAACATGPRTPVVDFKPDYAFGEVKKIAFHHESGMVSGDAPEQLSDMQRDRVDGAIRAALGSRGYQVVQDASDADLLVSWHLSTQHQTDVRQSASFGFGFGRGYRYGHVGVRHYGYYDPFACDYYGGDYHPSVYVQNYTKGKFIVDLIDPITNRSVWRGITQSRLGDDPAIEQAKYDEAAGFLFSTFPPQ